ncbi:uncharacterized protein PFL1_01818 [Pseudozyma flocculosa PF-1]|uniref:Related to signal recognition particle 9 protein (SRP9) n=1 Tax=Pseudozyma flocculosa TaxID=84751 RepID=A0A5C3EWR2_9BASI|nr:uncharacterized protein PFL1_01818 [Pseudozyma flocculosa PF-1]EPQ30920.1 hypothetical protein PFL1_01818 [Pseudozyma flocculosa PF-1]SPO36693.1 related to signal recognition particle 9 protein (SRP9) [Pseudozyma flocculosa]
MVYVSDWNDFQQRCIHLYQKSPERTRYLIKARPSTHQLVLKVTDDQTTLKFRTRSSVILGRFEVFNRAMMAAMAGHEKPASLLNPPTPAVGAATTTQHDAAAASGAASQATSTTAPAATAAGATASAGTGAGGTSSASKKKKKKGKK